MDVVARRPGWRILLVPLLIAALALGFVIRGAVTGSSSVVPEAPKNLTLDDLLLMAVKAKTGITMSYSGITGPPDPVDHTNHITLESFQFGVGRSISSGGSGRQTGPPSVSEVTVTKTMDQSSAALLQASLSGANADAHIYFTDTKLKSSPLYLEIHLENVLLSGFSTSSGGDRPSESLSLNFTKITYKATFNGDTQTTTYDLTTQS